MWIGAKKYPHQCPILYAINLESRYYIALHTGSTKVSVIYWSWYLRQSVIITQWISNDNYNLYIIFAKIRRCFSWVQVWIRRYWIFLIFILNTFDAVTYLAYPCGHLSDMAYCILWSHIPWELDFLVKPIVICFSSPFRMNCEL